MPKLEDLNIKIFCDSANPLVYKDHPLVKGFTTNPSLMHKAGIRNYEYFARSVLAEITDRPVSLEVFADEPKEMIRQARKLASWGDNVYVKIPITNTRGCTSKTEVLVLSEEGIKLNITGITRSYQVKHIAECLHAHTPSIISVFAGRIADTGINPYLTIHKTGLIARSYGPTTEVLWASCREVLNIFQAEDASADIITVTPPILDKLHLIGKDLNQYSLETVQEFYNDAKAAGYTL